MCLILLAHRSHPRYPLVVAANRDEFYDRPTFPARFWDNGSGLLAGRDGVWGGTWMGITTSGRFAAVTNYREKSSGIDHLSRGVMVRDFLSGTTTARSFAGAVVKGGDRYGGFNLLLKDRDSLWYCTNRQGEPAEVSPGVHGLSNHLLDTPWFKVVRGKAALAEVLEGTDYLETDILISLLDDRTEAPESVLPETGFGVQWERTLSPPFIVSPKYGTRSSTVILVDREGRVTFRERSFHSPGDPGSEVLHSFCLPPEVMKGWT